MCRVANRQPGLPRAPSSLALNASRDGASTTSLGNLFQCITTLWVKNFLLISNLNLPCLSLKPFPLVLSRCPALWLSRAWRYLGRARGPVLVGSAGRGGAVRAVVAVGARRVHRDVQ